MSGIKLMNEYSGVIDDELYEKIPKAVLAAIAVSYLSGGGDHLDKAQDELLEEWRVLYEGGIVPQKPPRSW